MKFNEKEILVIDDDVKYITILTKILEVEGAVVKFCTNLEDAYAKIEDKKPDLIFLDLNLLDEFGGDFLFKRKRNEKLASIPVCVCSANTEMSIAKEVIQLGVDDYIVKPIERDLVIQKVEAILNKE